MNELMNLDFEGTPVRVITADDGTPRWALADVCAACGIANPRNVAARLDDRQKGVVTMDTLGGPQKITVVNEDGLYDVILDSRKPEARRFRKWVTGEVLPSIRKHGAYMTPDTIRAALARPGHAHHARHAPQRGNRGEGGGAGAGARVGAQGARVRGFLRGTRFADRA